MFVIVRPYSMVQEVYKKSTDGFDCENIVSFNEDIFYNNRKMNRSNSYGDSGNYMNDGTLLYWMR